MPYRVEIQQTERVALFDVRGDSADMQFVLNRADLLLPNQRYAMHSTDGIDVLRIGRRRSLLRTDFQGEDALGRKLHSESTRVLVQCTCVSDMYQGISIAGEDAIEVVAQISPINFHELKSGSVAATEILTLAGYIVRESVDEYTIYVESSYGDYTLNRIRKCALVNQGVR